LAEARTCYDHLAGRLGVGLLDALADGLLASNGESFVLTSKGRSRFVTFGLDVETLSRGRRPLTRACLDWTERRHHLAGALGAALTGELFERRGLSDEFGLAA
jgi:hypothetical protein